MMNLLLKLEGYPPAVVVALLLHGGILWFLLDRTLNPAELVTIEPVAVSVATARENPQRLRRLEDIRQTQAAEQRSRDEARAREQAAREREATQRAEAERQRQAEEQQQIAERQRQENARKAEEERQAQARRVAEEEAARQRQAEAQRQQQAQAEAERQARMQAQANAEAQSVENDLVGQYIAIIQNLIAQNWVIPASARNGMVAVVELRTTPVGDITSYTVIQSSGDTTFDTSVLQAVARVGNLQELRDLPTAVYERNFRSFNLQFKPEDLLR